MKLEANIARSVIVSWCDRTFHLEWVRVAQDSSSLDGEASRVVWPFR